MRRLLFLAGLVGCDDSVIGAPTDTGATGSGGGWCGVSAVLDAQCASCHSPAGGAQGDLDLATDPLASLVDAASTYPGRTLVIPGDPDNSFLMAKLRGELGAGEGGAMPPGSTLSAAQLDLFAAWIADGATDVCSDTPTDPGTFTCDDRNEECAPGICGGEGGRMLPGADCLACHAPGHPGEGPDFYAAGTAFADLGGADPAPGAKIHLEDANGKTVDLVANDVGNFYTSTVLAYPLSASIETPAGEVAMVTTPSEGGCNACHACVGQAGGKLYAP